MNLFAEAEMLHLPEDPERTCLPIAELVLMPQQLEAVDPGDDWTGITSAEERRRRQNRLHQRTYRKRRNPGSSLSPETRVAISNPPRRKNQSFHPGEFVLHVESGHRIWPHVSEHTSGRFAYGIPTPLSLSMVIQLNTFNALAFNGHLLGIGAETLCDVTRLSPFNDTGSCTLDERCPPMLYPTIIQQTVPHHPWVDLLPIPRMRDNFIQAFQVIDEREIGADIVSVQPVVAVKPTLIVWGDPSNPQSWEASFGFLRKWGYLLRGCQELISATNYWREIRGEKSFVIDVS